LTQSLGWTLLVCLLLTLMLAVSLPSPTLSWLRHDYQVFGGPLNWLESLQPWFDPVHVLLFFGIGLLLRWVRPTMPWWQLAAWMAALACATEVLQFVIPGRHPRISDVRDDLFGAAIGSLAALAIGNFRRGRPADPSI
jgi:hypothetical protein